MQYISLQKFNSVSMYTAVDYKSKSGYKVNEMVPHRSHEVIKEHWVSDELLVIYMI